MKRFYFLAILIIGLILPSCNKEDIIMSPPILDFKIIVSDADGNVIIQGENGEEKIREMLAIEYKGKTYTIEDKKKEQNSDGQILLHEDKEPFYIGSAN